MKSLFLALVIASSYFNGSFGLDFFRKVQIPKKPKHTLESDMDKVMLGICIFSSGFNGTDSMPLHLVKSSYAIGGALISISGFFHLFKRVLNSDYSDEFPSSYPNSYETITNNLSLDITFLTGALFSLTGIAIRRMDNSDSTSDTALAFTIAGMTLMGLEVGKQFSKEVVPHIISFLNKH